MRQIMVGDLRVADEQAGAGPALILLHGIYHDSRIWRRQLAALSDEFTVVAWAAPGCGQSSAPPETFGLSDWADCLAALITTLGLERPHLLGLSLGSLFALELYRRHPTIPKSLVLASAYAGWAGSLPPEMIQQRLQRASREAELPPEQWVPEWIPMLLTATAPTGAAAEVAAIMAEFHPAGSRLIARALAEEDLRDILPHINVPTLLLYGDADVRSPVTVGEALHAQIPASKLVVMPGVGHLSNIDAPERFNDEVRRFIRSVN